MIALGIVIFLLPIVAVIFIAAWVAHPLLAVVLFLLMVAAIVGKAVS